MNPPIWSVISRFETEIIRITLLLGIEFWNASLTVHTYNILALKPVAHDAYFLVGLESCHRIGCDAVSAQHHQYDDKILIQLAIQQENKHRVLQAL